MGTPQNTAVFHDNHVRITYHVNSVEYTLRIPYHSKNKLNAHQMILIKETNGIQVEEDVSHRHGIPYFLSAKDLGGTHIVKRRAGEDLNKFEVHEIPK